MRLLVLLLPLLLLLSFAAAASVNEEFDDFEGVDYVDYADDVDDADDVDYVDEMDGMEAAPVDVKLFERTVCYKQIGCFSSGGHYYDAFSRPVYLLPQSPEKIGVELELFTTEGKGVVNLLDKDALKSAGYDAEKANKFIVHGFLNGKGTEWMVDMRKALITRCKCNVFEVTWGAGAHTVYNQAASNTRVVGAVVANFIRWLEMEGASRSNSHIIGFSLGAQVAGYAGRRLNEDKKQLGRISGLDPAGPYFEGTHEEVRLDPSDAKFVDVIHTDGGNSDIKLALLRGGFGTFTPVGHFDFYPNGGKTQPGCSALSPACDHSRAPALYTASIQYPDKFQAVPCSSYNKFKAGNCRCPAAGCPRMGYAADLWQDKAKQPAKFYSITEGSYPYFENFAHVKVELGSFKSTKGKLFLLFKTGKWPWSDKELIAGPTGLESGAVFSLTVPLSSTEELKTRFSWDTSDLFSLFSKPEIRVKSVTVEDYDKHSVHKFCYDDGSLKSSDTVDLSNC